MSDPSPAELVARWGFIPEGSYFVWNTPLVSFKDRFGSSPRICLKPEGWVVVSDRELSAAFPEPWQAAQDAVANKVFESNQDELSERQFRMLAQIGKEYNLPWTRTPPWGTPLPWSEGLSISWLEVASRVLSPEVAKTLPRSEKDGRMETEMRLEDLRFAVNILGEVGITLSQPSPSYRHWVELQTAVERCEDLLAAHDLLVAATPPQPERGQEVVAKIRIVRGDAEFTLNADMTAQQVEVLRKALLSTAENPIRKASLAGRYGEWLEKELPNYHPDMDLWYLYVSHPRPELLRGEAGGVHPNYLFERHQLMWRNQKIGEATGLGSFDLGHLPRPNLTHEALKSWVVTMAPSIKNPDLVIHQARDKS